MAGSTSSTHSWRKLPLSHNRRSLSSPVCYYLFSRSLFLCYTSHLISTICQVFQIPPEVQPRHTCSERLGGLSEVTQRRDKRAGDLQVSIQLHLSAAPCSRVGHVGPPSGIFWTTRDRLQHPGLHPSCSITGAGPGGCSYPRPHAENREPWASRIPRDGSQPLQPE